MSVVKRALFLFVTVTLASSLFVGGTAQAQKGKSKFRRTQEAIINQYIVILKDEISKSKVSSLVSELTITHRGTAIHTYKDALKGFAIQLSESDAIALSNDPRVDYVAEDGEVHLVGAQPNPPWGLNRIDQLNLPLDNTYNYFYTGGGTHAYVIDTGINRFQQEFGFRASIAADFVGDGQNGNDCNGHGTHVAGTIGGVTYGAAKEVSIHAVRVLDCNGSGSFSNVIAGIDWITSHHLSPAVANMSLGGPVYDPLDTAVRNSIASGVTYVVAAGNEDDYATNYSPARVTAALTVGAIDINDTRAYFSNIGGDVDLFAPGVDVLSAWIGSSTATNTISGTSMAAPHVAGVVAQFLQGEPSASPCRVANAIVASSTAGVVQDAGSGTPNRLLSNLFSPPSSLAFDTTGYYQIQAKNSGKCLNVQYASQSNAAQIIQWDCNGGLSNQWQLSPFGVGYYLLVNRNSGKCMDVQYANTGNGGNLIQWTCNGATNQQWQVHPTFGGSQFAGYFNLQARHSLKYAGVQYASLSNGANAIQWECTGGPNMNFTLLPMQ